MAEIFNKYEAEEQQNENASEITMDHFERTAKEEEFIASMKTNPPTTKEKEAKITGVCPSGRLVFGSKKNRTKILAKEGEILDIPIICSCGLWCLIWHPPPRIAPNHAKTRPPCTPNSL